MKDLIAAHFEKILELSVLLFIFVFSTFMLAYFKNEEMTRWIENGVVIAILARAFGTLNPKPPLPPQESTTVTVSKKTETTTGEEAH